MQLSLKDAVLHSVFNFIFQKYSDMIKTYLAMFILVEAF